MQRFKLFPRLRGKWPEGSMGASPNILAAAIALFIYAALAACSASTPSIDRRADVFVATGWDGPAPSDWSSVFSLYTGDISSPPLLGEYKESGGAIVFTPRFPPSPSVTLVAVYHPPSEPEITKTFPATAPDLSPTTRVVAIHPSADEWPDNTLRMYIEFSAPMVSGEAWSHLRMIGADGMVIEKPFIELEPELWSPDGKRLTVFFDPGRVKRGLVDNETSGPPLVAGRQVQLVINPGWRDARGAPLVEAHTLTIRAVASERRPLDVKTWKLSKPAKPDDPLEIDFGRAMDHALALRAISVKRGAASFDGDVTLLDDDRRWRFKPKSVWPPGDFTIVFDGVLEDVAGNRLGRAFDVDASDPTQSRQALPSATLDFSVVY